MKHYTFSSSIIIGLHCGLHLNRSLRILQKGCRHLRQIKLKKQMKKKRLSVSWIRIPRRVPYYLRIIFTKNVFSSGSLATKHNYILFVTNICTQKRYNFKQSNNNILFIKQVIQRYKKSLQQISCSLCVNFCYKLKRLNGSFSLHKILFETSIAVSTQALSILTFTV